MSGSRDGLKLLRAVQALQRTKLSIGKIAYRYKVSTRTAYRYIRTIEKAGYHLDQTKDGEFFIVTEKNLYA